MSDREQERQTLHELTERGETAEVVERITLMPPGDAAEIVAPLSPKQRAELLRGLSPQDAADILEDLPDDLAAATVAELDPQEAAAIVQEMLTDEETDLLQHLPEARASVILEHLEEEDAQLVRELLSYEEDTAGGLMRFEHISIPTGMKAGEVVQMLREGAAKYADYPASYLYVVDEGGPLMGMLGLRALLLCDANQPVSEIMMTDVASVTTDMPGHELVELFKRFHYLAMPVVDDQKRLVGIVTQEAAMRYAQEDAEEVPLRAAGIAGGDEFRVMPIHKRSWHRLSWLMLNVFLNVIAASVIALYEETLQAVIALAVFLPIISDMSGCSGNQAVAVSIRELSLGRIQPTKILWVVGKELSVGLINGFALGAMLAGIAYIWRGSVALGLIVGGALWINTLVAVVVGGSVPLILRRFGRDPAVAAGPLLTTLTDLCGFFVVLTLATQFLHLLR